VRWHDTAFQGEARLAFQNTDLREQMTAVVRYQYRDRFSRNASTREEL